MPSLPIDTILPKLKEAIRKHAAVVLHAPPGAGKTTRVPLALLDVFPDGKIVMLEPRRIAAVSAARWMAMSLGEEVGKTVGYAIRFDTKRSEQTRIEVVTEGILTRRLQADPELSGTSLVIFDEFHERSIHADLALALCLDIRKGLRPDLKILIMSATLDTAAVSSLLENAPVISCEGRSFYVSERHLGCSYEPIENRAAAAVRTALKEAEGDILVFLPGAAEIRQTAAELKNSLDLNEERLSLHPLYGDLPFEEQERAILPYKDRRKIVLATNIAETSLTIEGVSIVIDTGLTRILRHDPLTGMNRLVTTQISKASAEQRKGRAGRLGPGVCYRLYDRETLRAMAPAPQPEITVADIAPLALELAVWGVKNPGTLSWLDAPPQTAWESAVRLLYELGALDKNGLVTQSGREMVKFPLHPRLSRLLLRARELGIPRLGADIAALLTERDIFRRISSETTPPEPDISERIEALAAARKGEETPGADLSAIRAVERTAAQLFRMLQDGETRKNKYAEAADHDRIGMLLLSAFPDRVCKRRDEPGAGFIHILGRGVRLSRKSHLVNSQYIVAVHADLGEKNEGFVHLAAPVSLDLIRKECGDRIENTRSIGWDNNAGRIASVLEERLGVLILSSRSLPVTDEEAGKILCEAVKEDRSLLTFSKESRQFLARAALMRRIFPEENWPDLSYEYLFSKPEEWLLPWFGGARSKQDLAAINISAALRAKLSFAQQKLLDARAPRTITVPSGSRIAIDYTKGEIPVLAVKLQEMFGLADTPRIAAGKVKVLIHLLSPAGRPVQVTQDLASFWNTAYAQVKKDLKGRYPRHPWPDNPWNAAPTKRTKPR